MEMTLMFANVLSPRSLYSEDSLRMIAVQILILDVRGDIRMQQMK